MPTESITIFKNRSIAKNASITPATPIYLGKCGPDAIFWMDASLNGAGNVKIEQRICDIPEGNYYNPPAAQDVCAAHTSGRDRYDALLVGTEWFLPRVIENNASNVTIDLTLVVSMKG